MKEIFEERIVELDKRLKELTSDYLKAGVTVDDNIELEIQRLNRKRKFLLSQIESLKTPSEFNAKIYILVGTLPLIKDCCTGVDCEKFEKDRYHDENKEFWKPFRDEDTIEKILSVIKKSYGISPRYFFENLSNRELIDLDDNIENAVAIIDLFSINDDNRDFAQKFDTKRASVIFPKCSFLHHDLLNTWYDLNGQFKLINARDTDDIPCVNHISEVSRAQKLISHIRRILREKFPITNAAQEKSTLRGINIENT